jgi:transposase-like protein
MKAGDFERFLDQLAKLSKRQRHQLMQLLRPAASLDQVTDLIESAAIPRLACPRCGARKPYRHGVSDGLQRYRCVDCGRTFNALTSTPLARLRYKSR